MSTGTAASKVASNGVDYNALWDQFVEDVKIRAQGNWLSILRNLAPSIGPALDRLGQNVPCPQHQPSSDGFRVKKDVHIHGAGGCNTCGFKPNGLSLLMWVNDWTFRQALDEVAQELGMEWEEAKKEGAARVRPTPKPLQNFVPAVVSREDFKATPADLKILRGVRKLLDRGKEIEWTKDYAPTRYLARRGLEEIFKDPPQDLLFVPDLQYYVNEDILDDRGQPLRDKNGGIQTHYKMLEKLPAIIAIIRDVKGEVIGLHRIFFTEDGYKPFLERIQGDDKTREDLKKKYASKKLMHMPQGLSISGGAIRLYNANGTLGVGEGIETMLGARLLMKERQQGRKIPMWAGISAVGLSKMEIPEYVNELFVFGDNDSPKRKGLTIGPGEVAAREIRSRMLDRGGARIFLPARVDQDWEDVYNGWRKRQSSISEAFKTAFMTADELRAYEKEQEEKAKIEPPVEALAAQTPVDPKATEAANYLTSLQKAVSQGRVTVARHRPAGSPPVAESEPDYKEVEVDDASVARQAVAPWAPPLDDGGPPESDPSDPGPEPLVDSVDAETAEASVPAVSQPILTPAQAGVPDNWELMDRQLVRGKVHYRIRPIEYPEGPRLG